MKKWCFSMILVSIMGLFSSGVQALTVEEAYQSIPHQRTVFDVSQAQMPANDASYLKQLFEAMDLAIVAKVQMSRGQSAESAYAPVWTAWKKLQAPEKLAHVEHLYREAVEAEQQTLTANQGRMNGADPLTHTASQKLQQGYSEMLSLYPGENQSIKQAFFDYPCALDFY